MADGVNITPGTGVKISSEEVTTLNGSTVSAQQVGRAGLTLITADGTAVDVTTSAPLPVTTGLTQPTTPSDTQPVSVSSLPLPTGAATSANQTNGTQQTNLTDGTNVASVLSPGTANSSGNAVLTAATSLSIPFSVSSNTDTASTDAGNYKSVSVQINSVSSGSMTFQASDDGSTWVTFGLFNTNLGTATGTTTTTSSAGLYAGGLPHRYFRLHITGWTTGSLVGTVVFSSATANILGVSGNVGASQQGTWTVGSNSATGSAVPANAYYLGIKATSGNLAGLAAPSPTLNSSLSAGEGLTTALAAQFDDVSPTAVSENNFGNVRMNTVRALYGESGPYAYGRATADTQIKASAGFIHTISISAITATPTAGLLTVYDNTAESGTVIYSEWIFATDVGHSVTLDVPTTTGIYIGFDATLTNVQVTVSYR